MSFFRLLAVCTLAIGAAGCSVRPLPEDVTGYDTVQIVSRIRCEVRDAIRAEAIAALRRANRSDRYRELAEGLRDGRLNWLRLRAHLKDYGVDRETWDLFDRYNGAVIGYKFTFDIEEKNLHSGGADFLGTLTNGTVKLGLSASSDLTRGNNREFSIVDSFEFLATILEEKYCDPSYNVINAHRNHKNFVYPITGSLGLGELITSFIELNEEGNLVGIGETGAALEIPTEVASVV